MQKNTNKITVWTKQQQGQCAFQPKSEIFVKSQKKRICNDHYLETARIDESIYVDKTRKMEFCHCGLWFTKKE